MKRILLISILLILLSIGCINLLGDNPHRFDLAIKKITKLPVPENEKLVIFTGSSSIRLWKNLQQDCNGMQIINTGFGGSHMSDLLHFIDETVLRFQPVEVYIYEGDNDIAAKKKPENILRTTKKVVKKILDSNADVKINFISTKPSPSRWRYKDVYVKFNSLLKEYCDSHHQLFYIDVWNPMLNENGRPAPDIFVSDKLHMNRKGYLLWKDIICNDAN